MYFIIAKYNSKFGTIVYAAKVGDNLDVKIDMSNVYIHTLYLKGSANVNVGDIVELQTIKGENGLTYCFV